MPINIKEIFAVDYIKKKKKYFNHPCLNKITENKVFWKTVMPLLLDKGVSTIRISLINDKKMIT